MYTLIEAVRIARCEGHRWLCVDEDSIIVSHEKRPVQRHNGFYSKGRFLNLSRYKLTCNWRDTLIDLTKILVK